MEELRKALQVEYFQKPCVLHAQRHKRAVHLGKDQSDCLEVVSEEMKVCGRSRSLKVDQSLETRQKFL